MGRLMLNILLSFAQFEREVTGERIRRHPLRIEQLLCQFHQICAH